MTYPARTWWQFAAVTMIWGTTWLIIKTQLGVVPPTWSVAYRFAIGGVALGLWCLWRGQSLRLPAAAHRFALLVAAFQFVGNFNFVYRAEEHVASGIVAVGFALLMVPNALMAWLFLQRRVSARFLAGSVVGIAGVALLFAKELGAPTAGSGDVALGLALFCGGLLCASTSNVLQATETARRFPFLPVLAVGMLYGAVANAGLALWWDGAPVWDPRPAYLAGLLMLGVMASAVAFACYFDMIRVMGPGEAAWSSVLIPVIAMAISTVFEGYEWTALSFAGAGLAVVGMVVALGPGRRIA
ncbi:DMT family transporter [Sandaracinobacteroides saxicola]|uniref:DMT family transporter n=1 Tax=Sandaracinobacteroides saxicola TaxID=2759707 RepID=A0A7G5IGU2_9SPHN|nr:DMT family transporter [Sandaracinobacteroides saxicola]QMW22584.1 DMT family transporter [Sandaracinobacteroides saxicola]